MLKKTLLVLKNQSGAALVIAILMMVVLTLIGLGSIFTSTFDLKLSGGKRGSTDAFYAADSGVHVVVSNNENFNLSTHYVNNKYVDALNDPNNTNPNPTKAKATIQYDPIQVGAPRGLGISAINFEYDHFLIESKGEDQTELSPIKSSCVVQEKVVRLVPTLQGGY